ncbi:hypothetical protein K7432_005118 [Basidiobolus ranarum]|uniref:Uncharacterized protein n=1 Tax=Basidiobolus ranarum TaxID=34480 RepID=A0ABR2WX57_9FUNG
MNSIHPREANKFEKEEELLLWLQYERYLKQQIQDFECGTSERESEEVYSKYTQEEEYEILERIEQLKEKLVSTKVNNSIKDNLLINVDLAVGLKEELEKPNRSQSELLELTSTRDELTLEYMNLVEGLKKSKQELLKRQLSNQGNYILVIISYYLDINESSLRIVVGKSTNHERNYSPLETVKL